MSSKLPYKFLTVLLIFGIVLIVPYSLITYQNTRDMVESINALGPLSLEQKAVYSKHLDEMIENLISLAFYIFVIAFILSLFFSRAFLVPVRQLYTAAKSMKDGNLNVRLDVMPGDELAEVSKAFNEMAEALRNKTSELMRKDTYISAMRDPMWVANEDNVIIDINPAFTSLFGYERDEVIGSPIFDFLDDDSDRIMHEQLRERGKGESSSYEVSIISKRDGLIPVLISGSPIMEGGEVVAKIGIIKDFRAEKALRKDLREEKDFSEAVMHSISDALLVIDRDFRIVKANTASMASAGRDIVGEYCYRALHSINEPCTIHGEVCPAMTVFESGRSFKAVHVHNESGVKIYQDIVAYPVKDSQGATKYAVEIIRDVSDTKKLDEEIAQKNKELTALNSISRILSHSLKAEDIFDSILEKTTELTAMDGGGIYLLDEMGRNIECKYHSGLSEEFIRTVGRLKLGEDFPGRVAITGQSLVVHDISKSEIGRDSKLRQSGIKGYACTPIRGKEKMLGVFYIFSFEPHLFTSGEERILDSISEMTGLALENIRLYEKMKVLYEQQRNRMEDERQNLLGLSSMLSATIDIKKVLEASLALVKESGKADFVWLLDTDEKGRLNVKAASEGGLSDGSAVYQSDVMTIERAAIETKEPVIYSAFNTEANYYFAEGLKIYNTACSIPVHVGDKAIGALTLYYKMLKEIKEEDIHFMRTVASILAVALERAKLYDDVIIERGMASTILEGIADGVMTIDMYGTIISMNRAAEEIIGILPRTAVGMKRKDLFSYNDENEGLQLKMAECFDEAIKGRSTTRESDLLDIKGKRMPLMFKSAPVHDNRGEFIGVVYVLRDLSREKQLDMLKTEFVKAVSHEFRTPLASIVGMAEMVLDQDVMGDKAKEYLEAILSEGSRLSALVSDVLDVAKIESGKEIYSESEIDLTTLSKNLKETFEPVIHKKNIEFVMDIDKKIKGFRGDEDKLKHLLRNLLDNALTYSDGDRRVSLSVRKQGEKVKIVVRDEGWGMPDDDLRHAGEKFYRGVHAVKTTGTGLGLAISKEIVRMHGGELHIESKPGIGTAVTVLLPSRRNA